MTSHERAWIAVMRGGMANVTEYVGHCPVTLPRAVQQWAEDNAGKLDDLMGSFETALKAVDEQVAA